MRRKPLPDALDVDLRGGLTDQVTPNAGVALLIDAMRRAGVPAAAERHLPAKRSPKGLGQGAMVETSVLLSALGGDCIDDLDHLRRDMGLTALTGHTLPAASTARQWLAASTSRTSWPIDPPRAPSSRWSRRGSRACARCW